MGAAKRRLVPPRGNRGDAHDGTEARRAVPPFRDERLQEPALLGGRLGPASTKGDFARSGANALRQRSGVQARR
jgi:hypothetical protein